MLSTRLERTLGYKVWSESIRNKIPKEYWQRNATIARIILGAADLSNNQRSELQAVIDQADAASARPLTALLAVPAPPDPEKVQIQKRFDRIYEAFHACGFKHLARTTTRYSTFRNEKTGKTYRIWRVNAQVQPWPDRPLSSDAVDLLLDIAEVFKDTIPPDSRRP